MTNSPAGPTCKISDTVANWVFNMFVLATPATKLLTVSVENVEVWSAGGGGYGVLFIELTPVSTPFVDIKFISDSPPSNLIILFGAMTN